MFTVLDFLITKKFLLIITVKEGNIMKNDSLGDRMKSHYENIPKTRLTRREPVIIRIDGKAFHTFTRGFRRPFDDILIESMQETMKYLCENIQGCKLGYCQSDEISLPLPTKAYKCSKTAISADSLPTSSSASSQASPSSPSAIG